MRAAPRASVMLGAGLMALGAMGPWAQVESAPLAAPSVSGAHGHVLLVVVAAVVVLMRGRGAPLVGALSAVWIALGMYTLPGDLVQAGATQAQIAWGAYVALLGALLVVAAIGSAPEPAVRPSARYGTLVIVCAVIAGGLASAGWTGVGLGTPSSHAAWARHARDDFSVTSADGRARAIAAIEWHHGAFPSGLLHRGVFTSRSVVEAVRPVGCLWVKLEWGFPLGTVAAYDGKYRVKCKATGDRKPALISLVGQGYAKTLLNSATLTLCVSDHKRDGPRFCGTQKVTYSPV